ncbi:MAG: ABC transporter permease, partial [Bacteroidota bacterium]
MTHLRIAIRSFLRRPTFIGINLLGLTISFASAILMLTYISYEWSFDRFHEDVERIYRVTNDRYQQGELIQHGTITYAPVGPQMDVDFPEIDAHTRLEPYWDVPVEVDKQIFTESGVLFVDTLFPEIFDFPWLMGDPKAALQEPFSAILPANLVEKYFHLGPDAYSEAIGKTLIVGDGQLFVVRGIMDRVPANSHLQFDLLASYETLARARGEYATTRWGSSDYWHYVRLAPGVSEAEVEAKLPAFSERHLRGTEVTGSDEVFALQPLVEAHLFSDYEYEIGETNDGQMIQILLLVAMFVLIIAWINYINLSTARAMERGREVGVRKVLGAQRPELIGQFLLEAVLFNGLALGLAFLLVELIHPYFNQWLGVEISLAYLLKASYGPLPAMGWLSLIFGIGIILSGFYPAWIMSGYQPMTVLKGRLQHSQEGAWLRRGLVVFQFACSVGLVAATLTVYQQVQHMQDQDLGLNLRQTVAVDGPSREGFDSTYIGRANQLIAALQNIPGVEAASTSRAIPGQNLGRAFDFRRR